MQDFNPNGGRGAAHPAAPFAKFRPAHIVWREFLDHWQAKNPGQTFTARQAQRITGLSYWTVRRYMGADEKGAAPSDD